MERKNQQCKFFEIYSMKSVEDIPEAYYTDDIEKLKEFYMVAIKILDKAGEKARADLCRLQLKNIYEAQEVWYI